jgi:hypothetical protein
VTAAARALDAALALGLPVFPCRHNKAPACPRGFHAATAEPAKIRDPWYRHPGPLVGVPTGAISDFDVLDIDWPRHPEAAAWLDARRDRLPATRIHRTRAGGCHLLFRHQPGTRCWAGRPVPGVDGRSTGGFIIWWPAAGQPVLCDTPPAPWAGWLFQELASQPAAIAALAGEPGMAFERFEQIEHGTRYAAAALRNAVERVARAPSGSRNTMLNAEAFGLGRLVARGLLDGQAVAEALAAAAVAVGLSPREILATIRSAFAACGLA